MTNVFPSTILFKPDEGIKWICTRDSTNQYYLTIFLTLKYDDIRAYADLASVILMRDELMKNGWVELPCLPTYVLDIGNARPGKRDGKTFDYDYKQLSSASREKIYNNK